MLIKKCIKIFVNQNVTGTLATNKIKCVALPSQTVANVTVLVAVSNPVPEVTTKCVLLKCVLCILIQCKVTQQS